MGGGRGKGRSAGRRGEKERKIGMKRERERKKKTTYGGRKAEGEARVEGIAIPEGLQGRREEKGNKGTRGGEKEGNNRAQTDARCIRSRMRLSTRASVAVLHIGLARRIEY